MAIGLSAKQKKELAAMLPNVEESVASLRRLIADAKDRTKALAKLDEAEQAQRKHATEVGIPFNADAFGRRRAELNALPKMLTVEEGQLASFSALQRAIGVVVDGPYTREARGGAASGKKSGGRGAKKAARPKKAAGAKKVAPKPRGKTAANAPGKTARSGSRTSAPARSSGGSTSAPSKGTRAKPAPARTPPAAEPASAPRMPMVKPLPLALGS
jgi:hypothetical protein